MATELERLFVRLEVDPKPLTTGLRKADAAFQRTGKTAQRELTRADRALSAAAKTARLFVGALGIAVIAGFARSLIGATRRAVQFANEIGKTADKVGIGIEALQELRFAATQAADLGVRQLDIGLQRFSRRVGEAVNGTGELRDTLRQYNIQLVDSSGQTRALDDILSDYADAVAGASSQQEQLRLAFKAFDSEGAAIVNLLRQGSAGIAALRQEARDLGIVLNTQAVREAERLNDQLSRMDQIISVNLNRALLSLAPVMIRWANALAQAAPKIQAFFESLLSNELASAAELTRRLAEANAELDKLQSARAAGGPFAAVLRGSRDRRIEGLKAEIDELSSLLEIAQRQEALIKTTLQSGAASIKVQEVSAELQRAKEQLELLVDAEQRGSFAVEGLNDALAVQAALLKAGIIDDTMSLEDAMQLAASGANENASEIAKLALAIEALRRQEEQLQVTKEVAAESARRDLVEFEAQLAADQAAADSLSRGIVSGFQDAANSTDDLAGALSRVTQRLQELILEILLFRPLEAELSKGLSGLGFGAGGGIFSAIADAFAGDAGDPGAGDPGPGAGPPLRFAHGGDPPTGVPSIVGERGPELIVPRVPSTVIPNTFGGTSVSVVQQFTVNGRLTMSERAEFFATARQAGRESVNELRAGVSRGGPDSKVFGRRR